MDTDMVLHWWGQRKRRFVYLKGSLQEGLIEDKEIVDQPLTMQKRCDAKGTSVNLREIEKDIGGRWYKHASTHNMEFQMVSRDSSHTLFKVCQRN